MEMMEMLRKERSQPSQFSLLAIRGLRDHKQVVATAAAAMPSDLDGRTRKYNLQPNRPDQGIRNPCPDSELNLQHMQIGNAKHHHFFEFSNKHMDQRTAYRRIK
jgi:hypothetical protein